MTGGELNGDGMWWPEMERVGQGGKEWKRREKIPARSSGGRRNNDGGGSRQGRRRTRRHLAMASPLRNIVMRE